MINYSTQELLRKISDCLTKEQYIFFGHDLESQWTIYRFFELLHTSKMTREVEAEYFSDQLNQWIYCFAGTLWGEFYQFDFIFIEENLCAWIRGEENDVNKIAS